MEIKRMDIKEFQEFGYLQEVNRQFFHPLGLALEIVVDGEDVRLGGIWDFRNESEGLLFEEGEIEPEKSIRVLMEQDIKSFRRKQKYGFNFQPVPGSGIIPEGMDFCIVKD